MIYGLIKIILGQMSYMMNHSQFKNLEDAGKHI